MGNENTTQPAIVVFDIDGTMIGDIRPQLLCYEISNMCKKKDPKSPVILPSKELQSHLRGGIVRPFFGKFIKGLKEQFPNVELFVYTASEGKWAKTIVSHIEKAYNFKFNRPIFSRECCVNTNGEFKKNLRSIVPTIAKTLKKKYPNITPQTVRENLLMIDNSNVFPLTDHDRVLFCPTYDFKYPENIPALINKSIFEKFKDVLHTNLGRQIPMHHVSDFFSFQKHFYVQYIQQLDSSHQVNQKASHDHFFLYVISAMKKYGMRELTQNNIQAIKNKLSQKGIPTKPI